MPKSMTGGEAVYEALRALDVDTVFGIPSVHNIPIYDAILRLGEITPISVRHEQGALHAAADKQPLRVCDARAFPPAPYVRRSARIGNVWPGAPSLS